MAIRTKAYTDSNKKLASDLVKLPSDEILRRLAAMSEMHPELRVDVAREIVEIHKSQYPNIQTPGLMARAQGLLKAYLKYDLEKRRFCFSETKRRDPISYNILMLLYDEHMAAEKKAQQVREAATAKPTAQKRRRIKTGK